MCACTTFAVTAKLYPSSRGTSAASAAGKSGSYLVELHGVSRAYGCVQALSNVTLQLAPGTIGLVGNNGAGKSTLLKILLGLLAPDEGHGTILGHDLRAASRTLRGQVGYLPETAGIVPGLTGAEFVTLAGDLYGMPHRDARRRAHEVLNYVGLGELRYRRLEEYSTGNLQRLKLAAALVHDPQLLLLDEPTNGLDPTGREALLKLVQDLIAETGKSVILCTHLLGDIERLCEQVVVLHQGRVVTSGSMQQLKMAVGEAYEVGWTGESPAFARALESLGGDVRRNGRNGWWSVAVPSGFQPQEFFRLARAHGVVLVHLKRQEEDLERLFFRVTSEQEQGR